MPAAKPVSLDVHAIATLRYIRASMDAAGSVAIPGSAGLVVGTIGLVATLLSFVPALQDHWFAIWITAAPIAALAGGLLLARSASLKSFVANGTPGRKLALGLLPCWFAGAAMTVVLRNADLMTAIPGTWLLLYGCALIAASVSTLAVVAWMGLCFVVLGILALLAPPAFHLLLLGAGFGAVHVFFGILIARGIPRGMYGRET